MTQKIPWGGGGAVRVETEAQNKEASVQLSHSREKGSGRTQQSWWGAFSGSFIQKVPREGWGRDSRHVPWLGLQGPLLSFHTAQNPASSQRCLPKPTFPGPGAAF